MPGRQPRSTQRPCSPLCRAGPMGGPWGRARFPALPSPQLSPNQFRRRFQLTTGPHDHFLRKEKQEYFSKDYKRLLSLSQILPLTQSSLDQRVW